MPLTLIEAFRAVAPLTGDPATDRARTEAARVLHATAVRLAASTPLLRASCPHDRDEAIAIVLLRLVQAGPRAVREGDPIDDASVTRYLRAALHNAARDRVRSNARRLEVAIDNAPVLQAPSPPADELIDLRHAARQLDSALADLRSPLLPLAQSGMRAHAADNLRSSLEQLIQLLQGRTSVETIVAGSTHDDSPEVLRRARYALYQRHHRTIARLIDAWSELQRSGRLPEPRLRALRAVLDALRITPDSGPRKEEP